MSASAARDIATIHSSMHRARTHARTRGGVHRHRYVTRAHQHVVSRYPMWVNVSRTCELACKTMIRVSWMKHYSLSLSLSSLHPSLSLLLSFPRQSEWRFLRNLYCKSTDTADRIWEMGHAPRTKLFSETLVETLTRVLLSGRNQFYSSNFISTVRRADST